MKVLVLYYLTNQETFYLISEEKDKSSLIAKIAKQEDRKFIDSDFVDFEYEKFIQEIFQDNKEMLDKFAKINFYNKLIKINFERYPHKKDISRSNTGWVVYNNGIKVDERLYCFDSWSSIFEIIKNI